MAFQQILKLAERARLGVNLIQPIAHVRQRGRGEANRLAVYLRRIAVQLADVPAPPADEHRRQDALHVRPRNRRALRRNRRRVPTPVRFPSREIRQIVFMLGAMLVPRFNAAEIVFETRRLQIQPVFGFVEKEAQLPIDVARSEILRRGAHQDGFMIARFQIRPQPGVAHVEVAEVVRLVHQNRAAIGVFPLQDDAARGRIVIHVAPRFLIEIGVRRRGYGAVGDDLRAQPEHFVDAPPHGNKPRGGENHRRRLVRIGEPQLAQNLRADERLAQPDHVADVAAAVRLDHRQRAARGVHLEIRQARRRRHGRRGGLDCAQLVAIKLVQRLQIDVIRRRPRERPRALQLREQRFAYIFRIVPQRIEPALELRHLGVAGDADVQLGIAGEAGEREVGRPDDRRARLGVIVVPAQIRLRVERASEIRADFHAPDGDHVAQSSHGALGLGGLRHVGDAFSDAVDRLARQPGALAAPNERICVQPRPQRLRLLKPGGDLIHHAPVGSADQHANLIQPRQIVRHRLEPADEEVADGEIRPRRAAEHILEPSQQIRVGIGVQNVHVVAPPYCEIRPP